jgi:hypothetical protein
MPALELELALADATRRGLGVFPIPAGQRSAPGNWRRKVTTTPDAATWPAGTNIGVSCLESHLVVLDLDLGPITGREALAFLLSRHRGRWPDTYTVRTPSGGEHLYFRAPADRIIGSGSGWLGPCIDVRGPGRDAGGYVIGAGSSSAGRYYVLDDAPIADLPSWLARRLERDTQRAAVQQVARARARDKR